MQGRHYQAGDANIIPLWPPEKPRPLAGLYLEHDLRSHVKDVPLVYGNFVASLDGRVALSQEAVPVAIANDRDWRLFQELAIQADAILVSGKYMRARACGKAQDLLSVFTQPSLYQDLSKWRESRVLSSWPWIVVVTRKADFPLPSDVPPEHIVVLTNDSVAGSPELLSMRAEGVTVLSAGQADVDGATAVDMLARRGMRLIYTVGGPQILHLMAASGVLSRLYLTRVLRLLGGNSSLSLVEGGLLNPPVDMQLKYLYYDPGFPGAGGQLFGSYSIVD